MKHRLHVLALALTLASVPAGAQITGFVGPWAPTAANGFENSTGTGTFTTTVSADGLTLTSNIANAGDWSFSSFFLQNYGYAQTPPILLPVGVVNYDYNIQYFSPSGFVYTFDDFGNNAFLESGQSLFGHATNSYNGGYFGYFGVNIRGVDGWGDAIPDASAVVTLTNFSGPGTLAPEPTTFVLLAVGLVAVGGITRRRRIDA